VVAGDPTLQSECEAMRAEILESPRESGALKTEVVEMRQKMRDHLGSKNTQNTEKPVFHLKQDRGGIVDIEFMTQFNVLAYAHEHPSLTEFTDDIRILEGVEACGLMSADEAESLREAYISFRSVGHRLTLQGRSSEIADDELRESRDLVATSWDKMMLDE